MCCGEGIRDFMAIDHINGGGRKHRRDTKIRSGIDFVEWIIKNDFPDFLQLLCHNCNQSKAWLGKCPHESLRQLTMTDIVKPISKIPRPIILRVM